MISASVSCPACSCSVLERDINNHLDSGCSEYKLNTALPAKEESKRKLAPIFSQGQTSSLKSTTPSEVGCEGSSKKKRKIEGSSSAVTQSVSGREKRSNKQVFDATASTPLAERLRPQSLDEFVGQKHLTGPHSLLRNLLESGNLGGIIFWGPPGCGKTTLSRLLAREANCIFKEMSATSSGINDVRNVFEEAKGSLALTGRKTLLFLDEIHRFNKAQQDIFLPYIEKGRIQLIGATTENPSFKLTGALMSRCRVFTLQPLTDEEMRTIISRAVKRLSNMNETVASSALQEPISSQGSDLSFVTQGSPESSNVEGPYPFYPQLTPRVIASLISLSAGDARTALSLLDLIFASRNNLQEEELLASLRQSVSCSYDRTGDSRYDMISALHKSVRGSQGNAAMYWLARMLTAGEDPMYIARRMVVCASEDIGLADNHALPLAIATLHACQQVGMPECRINLAHLVAYLSEAPKSTRAYEAYNSAEVAAKMDVTAPVPMAVRNAPTALMKELGYSEGYKYNPQYNHPVYNDYLPSAFRREMFLKEPGDMSNKAWDEDALVRWETECNGGRPWSGRPPVLPRRRRSQSIS
ncbi:P-loop containing nucleoside triphosphate hydrolase protein [Imleria badia]|nr:P-loop containing nucleoside triphosphate hydrolase protein [Imleria badia]